MKQKNKQSIKSSYLFQMTGNKQKGPLYIAIGMSILAGFTFCFSGCFDGFNTYWCL